MNPIDPHTAMKRSDTPRNRAGFWDAAEGNVKAIRFQFKKLENRLSKRQSTRIAKKLANLAVHANSSVYYSEVLERHFLKMAWETRVAQTYPRHSPNSVLHVMTCCLKTGGHTRIVERWIESAPLDQKHSVALTRQKVQADVPERIQEVVRRHKGSVLLQDSDSPDKCRAHELRRVGMEYETIILHHNMGDPVPLMAFGLPEFERPVIVFNHAGHLFWLGRNAADMVIDIEDSQALITRSKRGFVHNIIVDLPRESTPIQPEADKRLLREALGIPSACHLVASMASAYKYTALPGYDFPAMLRQILELDPSSAVLMIGVASGCSNGWSLLEHDFPNRVFLKGVLPPAEAYRHLRAADLYIDSFPFNSFTSMLDAVIAGGLPAIALKTPVGLLPSIQRCMVAASSIPELVDMATTLLLDPAKRAILHERMASIVSKDTDTNHFQLQLLKTYRMAAAIPKDESRYTPVEESITPFDVFANVLQQNIAAIKTTIVGIAGFPIWLRKKNVYCYSLYLLGLPIYKRELVDGEWQRSILGRSLRAKLHWKG